MEKLLGNVPVFDGGGRSATTTFTQRGMGDVLVTFENEAILIANELGLKDLIVFIRLYRLMPQPLWP